MKCDVQDAIKTSMMWWIQQWSPLHTNEIELKVKIYILLVLKPECISAERTFSWKRLMGRARPFYYRKPSDVCISIRDLSICRPGPSADRSKYGNRSLGKPASCRIMLCGGKKRFTPSIHSYNSLFDIVLWESYLWMNYHHNRLLST